MGPRQNDDPHYRGMVDPITADKRQRVIPAYGVKRLVVDLSGGLNEFPLPIKGDFLWCDDNSTGVATIKLNNTSEDPFPVKAQRGLEGLPYEGVFISAAAQAGLILNLWYGYNARFLSSASDIATIGSIASPVSLASWLGANKRYSPGFMRAASIAASAGNSSQLQLFNPAASGVNLYVDGFQGDVTSTQQLSVTLSNVALTTLIGTGFSKTGGAANALAEIRSLQQVAIVGNPLMHFFSNPANNTMRHRFDEPIVLPPGFGLNISGQTLNTGVTVGFEWREGL